MFIGHFAIGFGAKKVAPGISLGALFFAAQFLDLLWPTLLFAELEQVAIVPGITRSTPLDFIHYPISHSLLFVIGWSVLIGVSCWLIKKNFRYAILLACCVLSHWLLDLLVHRPDLPITPGSETKVGFGLWNYPYISNLVEGILFITGVSWYVQTTKAKNAAGNIGLIVLVIFLLAIQVANMAGPPPPSVAAIAWAGQLQWLFILMGFWVDRNRSINKL